MVSPLSADPDIFVEGGSKDLVLRGELGSGGFGSLPPSPEAIPPRDRIFAPARGGA